MDLERAAREIVARELAPLIADCEQMRAELDQLEANFPILLNKRERAAAHVRLLMQRARLECQHSELETVADRVVALARERWPQWSI